MMHTKYTYYKKLGIVIVVCIALAGGVVFFVFKSQEISRKSAAQIAHENGNTAAIAPVNAPPEVIPENSINSNTIADRPLNMIANNKIQWHQDRVDAIETIVLEKLRQSQVETLQNEESKPIDNRTLAIEYLGRSINMISFPNVAVELSEYYAFTNKVDSKGAVDFSSGIAVRKSDGKIFIWRP